jgi:hypothetical protein
VSGTDGRDLAALPKGHLHLLRPGTPAELIGQGLAAIREWLEKETDPCETR